MEAAVADGLAGPRADAGMAYYPRARQLILFGGRADQASRDILGSTWTLDVT